MGHGKKSANKDKYRKNKSKEIDREKYRNKLAKIKKTLVSIHIYHVISTQFLIILHILY